MYVPAFAQQSLFFTAGNPVVTVEGCGVHEGTCTAVPNGTGNGAGNWGQPSVEMKRTPGVRHEVKKVVTLLDLPCMARDQESFQSSAPVLR
jgi:hypothetical protein